MKIATTLALVAALAGFSLSSCGSAPVSVPNPLGDGSVTIPTTGGFK